MANKLNLKSGIAHNSVDTGLSLLFGGVPPQNAENTIRQLPIAELDAHPKQSRWSMNEEELEWLTQNIAQVGVLDAVQVMQKPDGRYLLLEGHRRTECARRAGLSTVPAIVLPYDERRGDIIFNATNLGQRHSLRPSEKAFGYLDLEQDVAEGNKTTAAIAVLTGDNVRAIQRYKRLTQLSPELLARVDDGSIPVFAGVELSYLTEEEQTLLTATMAENEIKKLSLKQAETLHQSAESLELGEMDILEVLKPYKKNAAPVYPDWLEKMVNAFLVEYHLDPLTVTAEQMKKQHGKSYHGEGGGAVDCACTPKGVTFQKGRDSTEMTWAQFIKYCRQLGEAQNVIIRRADFSRLIPKEYGKEETIAYIKAALLNYRPAAFQFYGTGCDDSSHRQPEKKEGQT